jgi:hypothetical protein
LDDSKFYSDGGPGKLSGEAGQDTDKGKSLNIGFSDLGKFGGLKMTLRKKRTSPSWEDRLRAAAARAIQRAFFYIDPKGKSTNAKKEIGLQFQVDGTTIHKWIHGDLKPSRKKAIDILKKLEPGNKLLEGPPPPPQKQMDLNIAEVLAREAHKRLDDLERQVAFVQKSLETAAAIWMSAKLKIDAIGRILNVEEEPEGQKKEEKQNKIETHSPGL